MRLSLFFATIRKSSSPRGANNGPALEHVRGGQDLLVAIDDKVPKGKYLKVIKRVGMSPPQYPDEEE